METFLHKVLPLSLSCMLLVGVWHTPPLRTVERLGNIHRDAKTVVPIRSLLDQLDGVVQIACDEENAGGTGFIVDRSSDAKLLVLSSYRVIENDLTAAGTLDSASVVLGHTSDEPLRSRLTLLCLDRDRDLALLESEPVAANVPQLRLRRDAKLPEKNDSVFVAGFPMGQLSVLGTTRGKSGPMCGRHAEFWSLGDYSHSGQRGSPVFNQDAEVVGLWCGINWKNDGFSVTLPEIVAFLDENGHSSLCNPVLHYQSCTDCSAKWIKEFRVKRCPECGSAALEPQGVAGPWTASPRRGNQQEE